MKIIESLKMGLNWTRATASYLAWSRGKTPKESGRIQADDIKIFYKLIGYGEPILILHGGFSMIEGWMAQIPELSRKHLLIVMDSRGHGRTTLGTAGLTYRQMGKDAAALLDIMEMGPVTVLGLSDGGNAALGLAVERPDLVKGLVLMGTSLNLENSIPDKRAETERFLGDRSWELRVLKIIRGIIHPDRGSWPRFLEQMRVLWTVPSDVTLEDLSAIEAPTLIVAGDRDEFLAHPTDPLAIFKELRDAIPNASMTVIPSGSHGLHLEYTKTVNRLILEFMREPYKEFPRVSSPPMKLLRLMSERFASLFSPFARETGR